MAKAKTKAPVLTLAEDAYLRQLAASKVPVAVKLTGGEIIEGTVEIFDADMIRLAPFEAPSSLLYKEDIVYLWEIPAKA